MQNYTLMQPSTPVMPLGPIPTPSTSTARPGIKRKSSITPENVPVLPPPEKHFVTEEEMSEEMRCLQIEEQARFQPHFSNRTAESCLPFTFNAQGQFSGFGNLQQISTVAASIPPAPNFAPANLASSTVAGELLQNQTYNFMCAPQDPSIPPAYEQSSVLPNFSGVFGAQSSSLPQQIYSQVFGQPFPEQSVDAACGPSDSSEDDMSSDGAEKYMPRLIVSEELLKMKPAPTLPSSLLGCISPRQMALVPYVPPRDSIFKNTEDQDCWKKGDVEMQDCSW